MLVIINRSRRALAFHTTMDLGGRNRALEKNHAEGTFPHVPLSSHPCPPSTFRSCGNASRAWEQQSPSTPSCRTLAEIAMSCLLPPEILDHVIDQLPDDVTTLKACCLVSRSWIQRARKHLFANLSFDASTPRLELWKNTFPDSTNSPAHHTRTLFISYPDFIRAPDTILTFCNVERLDVIAGRSNDARISLLPLHGSFPILRSLYLSFYSLPDSGILDFICSFPLLEDLTLDCFGYGYSVQRGNAPSTSPRLSGSFKIKAGFEAARSIVRRLLDLPNGIHFAKISVPWVSEKDVRSTMDLVLGCANTLQSIDITTYRSGMFPSLSPPNL